MNRWGTAELRPSDALYGNVVIAAGYWGAVVVQ
jgi:hypothetical protein